MVNGRQMPKNNWPVEGFVDFSEGISRHQASVSPVNMVLNNMAMVYKSAESIISGIEQNALSWIMGLTNALGQAVGTATGAIEEALDGAGNIITDVVNTGVDVISGVLSGDGNALISEARKHFGKPYVWSATGPDGFDCSGLIYYLYRTVFKVSERIWPRRTAHDLWITSSFGKVHNGEMTAQQAIDLPQAGDLVFYHKSGGSETHAAHVAMCIGNKTGKMIHASSSHNAVMEESIRYSKHILGIRRVIKTTSSATPVPSTPGATTTTPSTPGAPSSTAPPGYAVAQVKIPLDTNRPKFISLADWKLVLKYCDPTQHAVDPYMVAAIGWHETNWGTTAGAGKDGYHFGIGVPGGGKPRVTKFRGLENQLKELVDRLYALALCRNASIGYYMTNRIKDYGGVMGPEDLVWIQCGANPGGTLAMGGLTGGRPWSKANGVWGYRSGNRTDWYTGVGGMYSKLWRGEKIIKDPPSPSGSGSSGKR
jgi:cell wall-associated NlpC family hydrolase